MRLYEVRFSNQASDEYVFEKVFVEAETLEAAVVIGGEVLEKLRAFLLRNADTQRAAKETYVSGIGVIGDVLSGVVTPRSIEQMASRIAKRILDQVE